MTDSGSSVEDTTIGIYAGDDIGGVDTSTDGDGVFSGSSHGTGVEAFS